MRENEAREGMISLETTAKVRRDHFVHGKSIKQISRERGISRNSVRKIVRSGETTSRYERSDTPMPKLGAFVAQLDAMLEANEKRARRDRFRLTRIFDDLRRGAAMTLSAATRSAGDASAMAASPRLSCHCPLRPVRPSSSTGAMSGS